MSNNAATLPANFTSLTLFEGNVRFVQALGYSGIFSADGKEQTDANILKRINHALDGDFSSSGLSDGLKKEFADTQSKYKKLLENQPYAQAVEKGVVNDLLQDYLALLVKAADEKEKHLDHGVLNAQEQDKGYFNKLRTDAMEAKKKYGIERDYYAQNPQVIKDLATKYEKTIKNPNYMSIEAIAVESGVVAGDPNVLRDIVGNVASIQAARSMKTAQAQFNDDNTLAEYASKPAENKVRIDALAARLEQVTRSLSGFAQEKLTPEVDRIVALRDLLSAQVNAAMKQERVPEERLKIEVQAREQLKRGTEVIQVLTLENLKNGASKEDPRTRRLKDDMETELKGQQLMSAAQAAIEAQSMARQAAEDLLQLAKEPKAVENITLVAKTAGVLVESKPLAPKSQLIGKDLLELIKEQNPIIHPDQLLNFAQALKAKQQAPSGSARGTAA